MYEKHPLYNRLTSYKGGPCLSTNIIVKTVRRKAKSWCVRAANRSPAPSAALSASRSSFLPSAPEPEAQIQGAVPANLGERAG